MSSTSQWIPYDSVAPIVLKDNAFPDWPFLSGTGFFVVLPPYDYVFFVTARHCVYNDESGAPVGNLQIPWNSSKDCHEAIRFSHCLEVATGTSGEFFEDVCVFVVGDMPHDQTQHITSRAIKLLHQDDVNFILNNIDEHRGNLRIVGFPSCSKEIDFDNRKLIARPRGLYGKIAKKSFKNDRYQVNELNWKDGELGGFSGSPVLSLHPTMLGDVAPVVVGVVVTGSSKIFCAVNVNIVTDLILRWIKEKQCCY